jgi:hypothetical protein
MTTSNSLDLNSRMAPELTEAQEERILEKLTEDPDEVITYYNSPEDEASDNPIECRFAVVKRGRTWDVYSLEFGDTFNDCLEFGGSFSTHQEAQAGAREWAARIEAETQENLDIAKDYEWEGRYPESTELEAPFTFTDNTDHEDGWELEDEEDVFRFFRRHDGLLRPEEWGNLYSCGLVDANGTACWVAESHRGEMLLYAE